MAYSLPRIEISHASTRLHGTHVWYNVLNFTSSYRPFSHRVIMRCMCAYSNDMTSQSVCVCVVHSALSSSLVSSVSSSLHWHQVDRRPYEAESRQRPSGFASFEPTSPYQAAYEVSMLQPSSPSLEGVVWTSLRRMVAHSSSPLNTNNVCSLVLRDITLWHSWYPPCHTVVLPEILY